MGHVESEGEINLINRVSKAVKTYGNRWALEVQGTFVKSSDRSGKRKNVCAKIREITELFILFNSICWT
jgi:hypothetical protein